MIEIVLYEDEHLLHADEGSPAKEYFAGLEGEAMTLMDDGEVLGMAGLRDRSPELPYPFIAATITPLGKKHPMAITHAARKGLDYVLTMYPVVCTRGRHPDYIKRWLDFVGMHPVSEEENGEVYYEARRPADHE
jgi:hypothetical protein